MADDTMSQDDINDLLGSIAAEADSSGESGFGSDSDTGSGPDGGAETAENGPRITIYDFVRPDLFSERLYERFLGQAKLMVEEGCAALSHLMGEEASGAISSVDWLTADELTRCLPNPSAIVPLSFSRGGKGAIIFTKPFASLLTRLFVGMPQENGDPILDIGSDRLLQGGFTTLAGKAFSPGIGKHLAWCETGPLRLEPEASIFGDPLEMVLLVSAALSLPACDGSETASFAFPGYLMAETIAGGGVVQCADCDPGGGTNAAVTGDSDAGEDTVDFLVSTEIQFPLLLGGDRILEAFTAGGSTVPVDPRIVGIMSYEKRREEK